MASKHWCFTLNNYSSENEETLRKLSDQVEYLVWGREVGDSGTPHLQGYVILKQRKRMQQVKTLITSNPHVEKKKGTPRQASDYCKKDGDFEEYGTIAGSNGNTCILEAFKDAVKGGELDKAVLREEHSKCFARYSRFCLEYISQHTPVPEVPDHVLKNWQGKLSDYLAKEPNDRTITFVVDETGGSGKTWFATKFCQNNKNAQYMMSGKMADMAYAINTTTTHLFVNCTRQQVEFLNYSFLEACKDGIVFSSKYESGTKYLSKMHVVVMMNQHPDMSMLSADRYNLIVL